MTAPAASLAPALPLAAFTHPVRIYWEDTDAGGIVFYANYLKYMERARTEWLRHLGVNQQTLKDKIGGMFVVTDAQIKYLKPARLDDQLIVTAQLLLAARASMTITQQVFLAHADGHTASSLLCEGSIRIGWVDSQSMRPARIPNTLLEKFS